MVQRNRPLLSALQVSDWPLLSLPRLPLSAFAQKRPLVGCPGAEAGAGDDFAADDRALVVLAALVTGAEAPDAVQRKREPSLVHVRAPSLVPTFELGHSWPAVAADAWGVVMATLVAIARAVATAMDRRRLIDSFRWRCPVVSGRA